MSELELAVLFHETYERLAPEYGYETRTETRRFDPDTPNGRLMVAVCKHIIARLTAENERLWTENTMQAATINGLRLPQTSMDGKTIPELTAELAEAREEAASLRNEVADAFRRGYGSCHKSLLNEMANAGCNCGTNYGCGLAKRMLKDMRESDEME